MAVTKEQVFAAADQIAAAGQRPTLEAVRQVTGGSYTTISPALNEWKAKQATTATPLREPAPQVVTDRLAEVGAEIWSVALELANARLAAEREALEKARADLEADRAEATELADRLTGQLEEVQSLLASSQAAEQAAHSAAAELRDQLAAAQEQAHTADARAQEIERRAGELRIELDRSHQDADQARQALAEQREAAQAMAAQLDQVRAELVKAQAKAEADQAAHQELRTRMERESSAQADRLTAATRERDEARQVAATAREDVARLAGQLTAHQEQTAALIARLSPAAEAPAKPAAGQRKKGGAA
jgi:colicin import membrane protein